MSFGSRIKEMRIEKHLSQSSLAAELGVSTNTISQYETDKRFPDQAGIINICHYFQISSDYLLGLSKIPRPPLSLYKLSENCNSCSDTQIEAINKLIDAFSK